MNTASFTSSEPLISTLVEPKGWARSVALIVGFSLLVALSAQVVIPLPFTPVPITGQTFAVLLTGALLGSRLGAAAMLAYLFEGAVGLPFFRGGNGGFAYLMVAPTVGYLLAYPFAAFFVGYLAERGWDRKVSTAAAAMLLGSFVILLFGWAGLLRFMNPSQAFMTGVAPFIVGDVIKVALAAALLPAGWKLLKGRASHQDR